MLDAPVWWHTPTGQEYWRLNLDALARGVSITRVFVCDRVRAELAALIDIQRRAGVTVKVVDRRDVDPALHLNLVVWDGRRAWEGRMNARGDIVANVFLVNQAEVDRVHAVYRKCASANEMAGTAPMLG